MRHPRRVRTAVLGALVTTATVFAAAGCTSGDADAGPTGLDDLRASASAEAAATADPSAGASPTEGADDDPKQAAIDTRTADAISRYKEYVQIRNAHAQRGEGASSELTPNGLLGSHAMREDEEGFGSYLTKQGYEQKGSVVVDSVEFVSYDGNPLAKDFAGHEIGLTACADLTRIDYVDAEGTSHFAKEERRRIQMDVVMRGNEITVGGESQGVWSVSQNSPTGKGC